MTGTLERFNWAVQGGYSVSHEPNIINNELGDGYSQRAPKGLNHDLVNISGIRCICNSSNAKSLRAFLSKRGGYQAFLWYCSQEDRDVKVYCPSWSSTQNGGITTFTMTFKEVL
ncbi:phage tail protein [Rodentibacter rarus]|uniref:phage tail protein n=1 Tax=Rodentibacter rarus TaxID=1908260 RepID=UPI0013014392|nr:phage tail protein [Rodentibacter rarus]